MYVSLLLPNLPTPHIEPAFMEMKICSPNDNRRHARLEYMEKTWIMFYSRPPATWSTFKISVCTNKHAKGWHHRLNFNAPHNHLNLYLLDKSLHYEASIHVPADAPGSTTKAVLVARYQRKAKRAKSKQAALIDSGSAVKKRSMSALLS